MSTFGTWERSSAVNVENDYEEDLRLRIDQLSEAAPGSIGDILQFRFLHYDAAEDVYTMTCKTELWMRNAAGTLHGGMCATILDQAMGFVSFCRKPGEGIAPTIQLEVDYHRPLIPGEIVLVKVRVISITHTLMHLSAEAMRYDHPEKVCLSGSGIYFYKPSEA